MTENTHQEGDEFTDATSEDNQPEASANQTDHSKGNDTGWSWGAFMFSTPFLIAIRKYAYLLIFVLALIPFVNIVFPIVFIGFKIYLGLKGRQLAEGSDTFANAEERVGFFKGFDWAGKVLFWVTVAMFALGVIVAVAGGLGLSALIDSSVNAPAGPNF